MKETEKEYLDYLAERWVEAEEIATIVGSTDNAVVKAFFNRLTTPYHYWKKENATRIRL